MQTSYDKVPYMGRIHGQTHPQHLYTIAKLFQFPAVDFKKARILELGCGDGSNIVNIAYHLPTTTCVGIDSSTVQIERGRKMCQFANINNCDLQHVDILTYEPPHDFDYIICHGVYSWVPSKIQKKIMEICTDFLSPNGIAYISYNTLPGWHQYKIFREMMKYHSSKMTATKDKIEQAKAVIHFAAEHVTHPLEPYGLFLRNNLEFISSLTEEYLFHEYLEEHNEALYFHQFVDRIGNFNLQYLGDTNFHSMISNHLPSETQDILNTISSSLFELEQYMDFLQCRRFRCSLLVKDHHEIERRVEPSTFQDFYFHFQFQSQENEEEESVDSKENTTEEVLSKESLPQGIPIEFPSNINEDNQKRIAQILEILHNSWPHMKSFEELIQIVDEQSLSPTSEDQKALILEFLQQLYLKNYLSIHSFRADFTNIISERPVATPISRYQMQYQSVMNSQLHDMILVSDRWVQELISYLDGTRTIAEIADLLLEKERQGDLEPFVEEGAEIEIIDDEYDQKSIRTTEVNEEKQNTRPLSPVEKREFLISRMKTSLEKLAQRGIIIS
jgi:methyltransferase-like protein/trans-aconitate methyltransferase